MIGKSPLPFVAALWARMAEVGVVIIFSTLALTTSLLFEELVNMADAAKADCSSSNCLSAELNQLPRNYDLICKFIEKMNCCFGPILLIQTASGFAIPIFEFYKILQTRGQFPRFYFAFIHTIFRFLILILIPSHLITQNVGSFTLINCICLKNTLIIYFLIGGRFKWCNFPTVFSEQSRISTT